MRLIDADALRREIPVDKYGNINTTITKFNIACEHSTVDAVSVTRCKDCRYYGERMENGLWRCNRKQGCRETIPEGFCGWAVPKMGEVEHETD